MNQIRSVMPLYATCNSDLYIFFKFTAVTILLKGCRCSIFLIGNSLLITQLDLDRKGASGAIHTHLTYWPCPLLCHLAGDIGCTSVCGFLMTSPNGNIFCVTGHLCWEFTGHRWIPAQRPVTQSFGVSFHRRLNGQLSIQSWGWWFATHRTHYDVTVMLRSDTSLLELLEEVTTWLNASPFRLHALW